MADVARLWRLAARADLVDDPQVHAALETAAATSSDTVHEQIEQWLTRKATDQITHPFSTPPVHELATVPPPDRLDLGVVRGSAARYTLPASQLTRHLLAVGETGAGKTTFNYQLIHELPSAVTFWCFDLKTDYRHLLQTSLQTDLVVLPWEVLRVNPLQPPPGVSIQRWAQTIQELFGEAYDLLSGSQSYLYTHLRSLYETADVPATAPATGEPAADEDPVEWPSLADLEAYIRDDGATGQTRSRFKERIVDRLAAVRHATQPMLACHHGYPLDRLFQQNVVFEFDGLAAPHQDFMMEFLLTWLFLFQATRQQRGDRLRHLVILDEGKRLFSRYKEHQEAQGLPQIAVLAARLREFGIGLVVSDQEPAKLADAIHANTATTALFRLGDGEQFQTMAETVQLSPRQEQVASQLAPGEAVLTASGRNPQAVDLHYYPLEKSVTDTAVRDQMEPVWDRLQTHVVPTDAPASSSTFGAAATPPSPVEPAESADNSGQDGPTVSEDAEILLQHVARHPFAQLMDRYHDVFDRVKRGISAKTELVENGFIREKQVRTGDGRFKLLELTGDGRQVLRSNGITVERQGRGGIVHRYWQHRLQAVLQAAGWDASLETHDADVYAERDGESVAIEIAMRDRDRERQHVEDRLEHGIDRVVVLGRTHPVCAGLRQKLADADLPTTDPDTVAVHVLHEFAATLAAEAGISTEFDPAADEAGNRSHRD